MSSPKKYADADATAASLSLIAATLSVHGMKLGSLEKGQADLQAGQARIEEMLAKILEGQAILHQNDMELKRRLDTKE